MTQNPVDAIIDEWGTRFGAALDSAIGTTTTSLADARKDYDDFFQRTFPAPTDVTFEETNADGVTAEWFTPTDLVPGRVLLYLHGGAYIVGGPRGYHGLVGILAEKLRAKALVPDYRLAPEAAFPAPIDDCVTAYRWLLREGIAPENIIVAGDSAGGAMAVSVLVAARNEGLPMPAASIAFSPWANLEHTGDSMTTRHGIDPLNTRAGLDNAARIFLGNALSSSSLASPVYADTRGLPPVLIQIGEHEVMLSDAIRLAARLADDAVPTRLDVAPGMPHVWHLFAAHLPAAEQALNDAAGFADQHLPKG